MQEYSKHQSYSYVKIINNEVVWLGGDINVLEGDRQRSRRVLLHAEQIKRLIGKTNEKGLALLPLKLYLTRGLAKLELGVGRGLKKYDKRAIMKKRSEDKEAAQKARIK